MDATNTAKFGLFQFGTGQPVFFCLRNESLLWSTQQYAQHMRRSGRGVIAVPTTQAALAAPTSSPADAVKAVEELQASDGVANQNLTKGQTPPARGAASDAGNGAPRGDVEEGSPASINSADPVQLMKLEAKQEVLKGHPYISNR